MKIKVTKIQDGCSMFVRCSLLNGYALLQDFTLTERRELLELRRKLMLNIFVSALNFYLLSGSKFQRKAACKNTSLHWHNARQILVATIFFYSPWRPKRSQLGALHVSFSKWFHKLVLIWRVQSTSLQSCGWMLSFFAITNQNLCVVCYLVKFPQAVAVGWWRKYIVGKRVISC